MGSRQEVTSLTSLQKTKSVPQTMINADSSTLTSRLRVMMLSLTLRGGFLMTSRSTGSTPRLTNGKLRPLAASMLTHVFSFATFYLFK